MSADHTILLLLIMAVYLSTVTAAASSIDPTCANALTRNDTHKHLKKYVGFIKTDIIGTHPDKTYIYKIGICIDPEPVEHKGCGIVQHEQDPNGTNLATHCIGKISHTQVTETKDHTWVELTYAGGDQYHSHCQQEQRKGRIVFLCDPLIPGMGNFEFLEENRDDDLCYYLFTLASRQVCGSPLTAGDIILILMACLVFMWIVAMICGFLYKRFFLGAKGYEQIPLISFYREFGNLEADGCDFVCRSSNSVPPSQYKPPAPPFSAETDEETDEEKDDNLLPM